MLRMHVHKSIKVKAVLAFPIAGSVPMIVSMVIINQRSQEMLLDQTKSAFIDSVSVREGLLNDHIEAYRHHAQIIARFESVRVFVTEHAAADGVSDDVFAEVGSEIAVIQKELWGESHHIFLVNSQGTVVLNAPNTGWESAKISIEDMRASMGPHMDESIAGSDHFGEALETTVVTGFFAFQENGHYHQMVLSPIKDDSGETIGLVGIEISVDYMIGLLQREVGFDSLGRLYLATKDGRRVVHETGEASSIQIVDNTRVKEIEPGATSSGWFEYESGQEVFGVCRGKMPLAAV